MEINNEKKNTSTNFNEWRKFTHSTHSNQVCLTFDCRLVKKFSIIWIPSDCLASTHGGSKSWHYFSIVRECMKKIIQHWLSVARRAQQTEDGMSSSLAREKNSWWNFSMKICVVKRVDELLNFSIHSIPPKQTAAANCVESCVIFAFLFTRSRRVWAGRAGWEMDEEREKYNIKYQSENHMKFIILQILSAPIHRPSKPSLCAFVVESHSTVSLSLSLAGSLSLLKRTSIQSSRACNYITTLKFCLQLATGKLSLSILINASVPLDFFAVLWANECIITHSKVSAMLALW